MMGGVVALSGNGRVAAVRGHIAMIIIEQVDGVWVQKGNTISTEMDGNSISMDFDGNLVASLNYSGRKAVVHRYTNNVWNEEIVSYYGEGATTYSTINLSSDGTFVAYNYGYISSVYKYENGNWSLFFSKSQSFVTMSRDKNTLFLFDRTSLVLKVYSLSNNSYEEIPESTYTMDIGFSKLIISHTGKYGAVLYGVENTLVIFNIQTNTIISNTSHVVGKPISMGEFINDNELVLSYHEVNRVLKITIDNDNVTSEEITQAPSSGNYGNSMSVSRNGDILLGTNPYDSSRRVPVLLEIIPPDTTPPTLTLSIPEGTTKVVYKNQPFPTDKYIVSVSDNITTPSIADVTISSTGLTGNVFTTAGVYDVNWSVTDGENITSLTRTFLVLNQAYEAPICFTGNTPITTDQGEIEIKKLIPGIHTINGQEIKDITETVNTEESMVRIEKGAFSKNIPERETVMTNRHKVYYRGEMVEAGSLVGKKGVTSIDYTGEYVYNVVLGSYTTMTVNGMTCETLDPENIQYRMMRIHKEMLAGRCTEEMGVEFMRLKGIHECMC